jgi:hypothetical protein
MSQIGPPFMVASLHRLVPPECFEGGRASRYAEVLPYCNASEEEVEQVVRVRSTKSGDASDAGSQGRS